jgi:hypothetical protein
MKHITLITYDSKAISQVLLMTYESEVTYEIILTGHIRDVLARKLALFRNQHPDRAY